MAFLRIAHPGRTTERIDLGECPAVSGPAGYAPRPVTTLGSMVPILKPGGNSGIMGQGVQQAYSIHPENRVVRATYRETQQREASARYRERVRMTEGEA